MAINNNAIYNAAFVGAVAGITERWINSTVQTSYDSMYTAARRLAANVDALIAPTTISDGEAALLQGVVKGVFANRFPQTTQDFADISRNIVACFDDGISSLQPSGGGGGGTTVKVDVNDTTADYLAAKLSVDATLSLTILNPGGNEQIRLGLFVAFDITSFGTTGSTLVLAGASVVNPAFTASYNQLATAVSLTDTEGHNDVIALPGTAFVSPHTFTKTVYGQSVTFTLHASNANGADTAAASITWGQNVFFGSAVDPGGGGYNTAFLNSLGSSLRLSPNGSYNYNAGALESAFWACRAGYGVTTANFTVGGFPFSCSKVATFNYTNANGVVESYDLFRSDNIGLGPFTLVEA